MEKDQIRTEHLLAINEILIKENELDSPKATSVSVRAVSSPVNLIAYETYSFVKSS